MAAALAVAAAWVAGCSADRESPAADEPPAPVTSSTAPAPGGYGSPTLLGRLDPVIDESSGLAASRRNPGLLWTHNDSDDGPVVYCTDRQARSCGSWRVTGASARDWEDIAVGPGPETGRSYLYVADIGDNLRDQRQVVVYRVPEPAAPARGGDEAATEAAERIVLRYADGPHDAEALLVHPTTADLYVVTKDPLTAGVYKAGPEGVLERIAGLAVGAALVTGGDISPDGRRAALCTYAGGFELELPAGAGTPDGFDAIWRQPPQPVELPTRIQGEAVAYRLDGKALLTTSEGAPAPLQEVERT